MKPNEFQINRDNPAVLTSLQKLGIDSATPDQEVLQKVAELEKGDYLSPDAATIAYGEELDPLSLSVFLQEADHEILGSDNDSTPFTRLIALNAIGRREKSMPVEEKV